MKDGKFVSADGTVKYFKNGLLHRARKNGPAIKRSNGIKEYYWKGKLIKKEYNIPGETEMTFK